METTVIEPTTEQAMTLQVIEGMPQEMEVDFVPAPLPSDAMQAAFDAGWELRHGVYQIYDSIGCAVGSVNYGMKQLHLEPPKAVYALSIPERVTAMYPQLSRRVPLCAACVAGEGLDYTAPIQTALEHGYESHGWSKSQCLKFLRDNDC